MADGSLRQFDIYSADVWWDGIWRQELICAVGSEALLGMRMLADHELRIIVRPGETVEITPLP